MHNSSGTNVNMNESFENLQFYIKEKPEKSNEKRENIMRGKEID